MSLLVSVLLGLVAADGAADVVTLRDGSALLGQWVEAAPRGKALVIVRRAWAEANFPRKFKAWEAAEASWSKRAREERAARLRAWLAERLAEPNDVIRPWIEAEIDRLKGDERPPLMVVTLGRSEVKKLDRRPPEVARKLRQAWRAKFEDAEAKPLDALASALEGRGFPVAGEDPAAIDDLLPIAPEPEARWMARRAATEVGQDKSTRFIRYQGLVLPEGTPGQPIDGAGALSGVLKGLIGGEPEADPLEAKGRELAARGLAGMLVTRLDTAEDLSGVKVEITLYARSGDRWGPVASRVVSVSGDEAGDGANLEADPQVGQVFKAAEGLGLDLGDLKGKSLRIGAATQKALGAARTAIQPDLDALALPIDAPPGE